MKPLPSIAAMILTASLVAAPVVRQQVLAQSADAKPVEQPLSPKVDAPAAAAGTPNLVVATVKLDGGWRASKLIGSPVYDDQNQKVGAVDDLIMAGPGTISVAIVSVGGFLGIGSKLVAVPYDHLHYNPADRDAKVVMPGANKDTLNQMPGFTYGNG